MNDSITGRTEPMLHEALGALTRADRSDLAGLASQYAAVYKMRAVYCAAENALRTIAAYEAVAEAARGVVDGWQDYVEAQAGRGHIGQVHVSEAVLEGGCGRCEGARYGTEVAMAEYVIPTLRAALAALDIAKEAGR